MRAIKSIEIKSAILYGAVLAALWTFAIGLYYWILGWIFGAQSWWIDVNIANWTVYTFTTFGLIFLRAFFAAIGGAFAGWVVALVYNLAASMMGGLRINLD